MKKSKKTGEFEMIAIGSDHGGFELKCAVIEYLNKNNIEFTDVGCYDKNSVDYPDIAEAVCKKVTGKECELGILICGTGIGISIAANKIKGIRAALCHSEYDAKMTKAHNNANVLCMGGRTTGVEIALAMVKNFLESKFEGGRHEKRIEKITALENKGQL